MSVQIKVIPEDFIVNEVQTMFISPLQETLEYVIILVGKKGFTTFEAISAISEFCGISTKDLGYAGLKDEDAITYQMVSLPVSYYDSDAIERFNVEYSGEERRISIVKIGYSDRPIKIGRLQGNSFKIRLRNVPEELAMSMKSQSRRRVFFPNYYDTQRFGIPNMPKRTHLIGKALYENDFDLALQYMKEGTPDDCKNVDSYENSKCFFAGIDNKKLTFYYNAFTSTMFNNYVNNYIKANMSYDDRCLEGLLFYLPLSKESHSKMDSNHERICVPRYDVDSNMELSLKYYYRYTFVDTIIHVDSVEKDVLHSDMYAVNLDFFLPSGCYATMAVSQFVHDVENE